VFHERSALIQRCKTAGILAAAFIPILAVGSVVWDVAIVLLAMLCAQEWQRLTARSRPYFWSGMAYIALGLSSALWMRHLPDGVTWVLFVVACVAACDSAAYVGGKYIGRRKLIPSVSPGKTWEGFGLGLAGSVFISLLFAAFTPTIDLLPGLLLGAVLGIVSQAGDLLISAVKRWAGVKDTGHLLPGHGGVLDRLDSHLAAFLITGLWLIGSGYTL
jgi:phosphatidate cytidylyltransferase